MQTKRQRRGRRAICQDSLHSAVLPKAQVRAPPPCRGHGGHASSHRRGGDGAARERRAGAHVAVGSGRARGRAAAHALPPLPDRGRSVHRLLGHVRGGAPAARPGALARDPDPQERLAVALDELYRWYEQAEPMLTNLYRDRALVEAVDVHMRRTDEYVERAARTLAAGSRRRVVERGGAARRGLSDLALARARRRCEPRAGGQAGERSGPSCARPAPVAAGPPAARSQRAARRRRTRAGRRR